MLGLGFDVSIRKEVHVSEKGPHKSKGHELWGWLLFTVSALFFIGSSLRNGDLIGLLGGVFFLLACAAFLAPYLGAHRD